MKQPRAAEPAVPVKTLLPGAQFADAYCLEVNEPALTARAAAERMMGQSPLWVTGLMRLRNMIVAPLGLQTPDAATLPPSSQRIGIFPVVSQSDERLVLGFDDHHLDFRVVVDVGGTNAQRLVTASTLVRTHNRLGRIYLTTIMPFHRLVVRGLLKQVDRP